MSVTPSTELQAAAEPTDVVPRRRDPLARVRRWLRAGSPVLAAGAALGAQAAWGWAAGAAVVATVGLGCVWAARLQRRETVLHVSVDQASESRLATQVVPVWQRNVDAAKNHSARSMDLLLESFSSVSEHLDKALLNDGHDLTLDAATADQLIERHQAELDTLLAGTRSAVQAKDEMLTAMMAVADDIGAMLERARDVQSISRATHLLAMNASVEATRAGASGAGMAVVAQEVRALAGQSRQAANDLAKHLTSMRDQLDGLRRQVRKVDTDDDELQIQADQAARSVLRGLLSSIAEASRSSRDLRLASRQVQADLEKIFMGLQSQDRLSQMLTSVTDDMGRYAEWLQGKPDPAGARPTDWLARLEASYTMEDMRTAHHGNVVIEQGTSVEFF